MSRPTILLNPGPVTLSERVRTALAREDLCHREPEFAALTRELRAGLCQVYDGARGFEAVLLTGSGTAAVEAMVASLVPRAGRALVVANGVYGERIAAMLAAQGKAHDVVAAEWTAPVDLASVRRHLAAGERTTHVVTVHHETTTGRLNDLAALGALCREHGRPLLVDAVSSFGGEALELATWGVEAVAATANKCLHGVPGIAFVLARSEALEGCAGNAPGVYLDLARYRSQAQSGFSPYTQAVHVCYALAEALAELADAGGWHARHERYRALSDRIGSALAELGVEPLLPPGTSSSMLRAYRLPAGTSYDALHDDLKRAGFVIYAGQGGLAPSIFRVATMGDLRDDDVERLLGAFAEALRP